jgi:hypothetical protein
VITSFLHYNILFRTKGICPVPFFRFKTRMLNGLQLKLANRGNTG